MKRRRNVEVKKDTKEEELRVQKATIEAQLKKIEEIRKKEIERSKEKIIQVCDEYGHIIERGD